jgi:hypothetical protein
MGSCQRQLVRPPRLNDTEARHLRTNPIGSPRTHGLIAPQCARYPCHGASSRRLRLPPVGRPTRRRRPHPDLIRVLRRLQVEGEMRAPGELGTNTSSAHARRIEWTPVLDREGRKRAFVLRRGLTALLCQRTEVLLPTRRHVLLGRAVVVCGREERSCALDGDQDDRPDAFFPRIEATRRQ